MRDTGLHVIGGMSWRAMCFLKKCIDIWWDFEKIILNFWERLQYKTFIDFKLLEII